MNNGMMTTKKIICKKCGNIILTLHETISDKLQLCYYCSKAGTRKYNEKTKKTEPMTLQEIRTLNTEIKYEGKWK